MFNKIKEKIKANNLIKIDGLVIALTNKGLFDLTSNRFITNKPALFGFSFNKKIYYSFELEDDLNYFDFIENNEGVFNNDKFSMTSKLITENCFYINGKDGVYQLNQLNQLKKVDFIGRKPKFILSNKAIYSNNKILSKNFDNGVQYWVHQYNELLNNSNGKLYGNIQIIKNKLFFFLFDSSRQTDISGTFCLDIETGKQLWKSNEIGGWLTTFQDKIYSLQMKTVKILNPDTFEIETIDLTEQLSVLDKKQYDKFNDYTWDIPFRFSVRKYVIEGDYLYFSQDKRNTIGIINLKSHQLEWHSDIEIDNKDNPVITDLKVSNDKLYVQDSANTLHIFERQKKEC